MLQGISMINSEVRLKKEYNDCLQIYKANKFFMTLVNKILRGEIFIVADFGSV